MQIAAGCFELRRQEAEKRRLSRTGFTDDGEDFTFVEIQVDIDAADARPVELAKRAGAQDGMIVQHHACSSRMDRLMPCCSKPMFL